MKIWFDITNSPHVLFFKPIIDVLKKDNEIIITTRKHSQTIDLLKLYDMKYDVIGEHAGKSKIKKLFEYFSRMKRLYYYAKDKNIDTVVVHQSPYSMMPAFFLGIKKKVFIFDNETAQFQNMLAIPFATHVLCPEAITKKRIYFKKLIKYPGIKESVYVKKTPSKIKKQIIMRPEPWSASYYSGKKDILTPIINGLYDKWKIILLPRDQKQKEYYNKKFGKKVVIPKKISDGPKLISESSIVIGAGGTMNREAVALGVPVISTYNGKVLAVDRWLIDKKLMYHYDVVTSETVEKCILNHKKASFKSGLKRILEVINENN
jgi:predicted glycosyltransferase